MYRIKLGWRVLAAVVALGATTSVVWGMSNYAYPQSVEYLMGELAGTVHWGACPS
jgi:hypothetical protein